MSIKNLDGTAILWNYLLSKGRTVHTEKTFSELLIDHLQIADNSKVTLHLEEVLPDEVTELSNIRVWKESPKRAVKDPKAVEIGGKKARVVAMKIHDATGEYLDGNEYVKWLSKEIAALKGKGKNGKDKPLPYKVYMIVAAVN